MRSRERQRLFLVVRHQQRRHAEPALKLLQLDLQLLAQLAVERAERLVEQQDVGLEDDRTRQRHALLLAAGKLRRPAILQALQPHQLQRFERLAARGRAVDLAHAERKQHVLQHRHVREQRVGLEHQPDVALLRRRFGDVAAADEDAARGRPVEAGDQRQQRRLARAARPQDGDELALRHREIDLVRRRDRAVALRHAFEADVAHAIAAIARSAAASVSSMIASSCAVERNHLACWLVRMPSSCSAQWNASALSRSQATASR